MRDCENDDELMKEAAEGDKIAFDRIVRRHQHLLQRFSARMLGGDTALAGDVTVGAFLRLWEHRYAYQPRQRLVSWLLRTAFRLCVDELESRKHEIGKDIESLDQLGHVGLSTETCVERSAMAQAIREAVSKLPETQRAVVLLSVCEEMSYDEISEILDIPSGTVGSRKSAALIQLRRQLVAWEDLGVGGHL